MTAVAGAAIVLAVTAALGAALVGALAWLAVRRGWLDVPVAHSAHRRPVPRIGGLGIAGAIVVAALVLPSWWSTPQWVGFGLIAVVGFLDDLWNLPATPRLITHVVAAALIISGHTAETSWMWQLAAVIWIAGFINAFNFMDGSDGIAGLHATVAGVTWMTIGLLAGETRLSLAGAVVAGACAGFLVFNWMPARIFMGDLGATLLGAMLASMPWVTSDPRAWLLPAVVVLAPFWVDAGVTLIRRIWRGEHLFERHQQHFYQQLIRAGLTHSTVALGYGAMTAIAGVAALGFVAFAPGLSTITSGGVLAVAAGLMGACAHAMRHASQQRAARAAGRVVLPVADPSSRHQV